MIGLIVHESTNPLQRFVDAACVYLSIAFETIAFTGNVTKTKCLFTQYYDANKYKSIETSSENSRITRGAKTKRPRVTV